MTQNRKIVLGFEHEEKIDELSEFIAMQDEEPSMRAAYTNMAKETPDSLDGLTIAWLLNREITFSSQPLEALLTALAEGEKPKVALKSLIKATGSGNQLLKALKSNTKGITEAVVMLAAKKGLQDELIEFGTTSKQYYEHE